MPIAARKIAAKPVAAGWCWSPAAPGEATASASLVPDEAAPEPPPAAATPAPSDADPTVPDCAWPWTVQK